MRKFFRLKEFRSEFDLKQSDIAKILKCHQTNISRIESQFCDLEDYQYKILYEKYGQDAVDKYRVVSNDLPQRASKNALQQEIDMSADNTDADLVVLVRNQTSQISSLIEQNKALTEAVANLTKLLGEMKVG